MRRPLAQIVAFRLVVCLVVVVPLAACGSGGVTDPGPVPTGAPPPGWSDVDHTVTKGERVTFSSSGTINMWPNCEETKVAEGYPSINCSTVHAMGPEGTDLFPRATDDYPMPGAKVMALVGRIGDGPPFVVGRAASVVADRAGVLQLTANDPDWRKADDSGAYKVTVKYKGGAKTLYVR